MKGEVKTIKISKALHTKWKTFCSQKEIQIEDATEIALELAMIKKGVLDKK